MNWIQSVTLGLVQGLTEFLPISSSGHLRIVPALFGWDDPGTAFTAVVQLGTILAVLLYFRHDIVSIARGFFGGLVNKERRDTVDYRLGWCVVIGTLPISIIGLAVKGFVESGARNLVLIATMLIVFAFVMLLAEVAGRRTGSARGIEDVRIRDGWIVGFSQALALVPGVSRSGATISAGLAIGMERAAAARFSFLLSIPAIVLSGLYELKDLHHSDVGVAPMLIATAVAFVSGYVSIAFLLNYLGKHTLGVFVGYRIIIGVVVLALVAAGSIH